VAHELPQLPGVKHQFVTAGGLRTHLAVAGEGEPVLLLHGWPEHWYAWRAVIPRLAEHYRVICLDLRGFGWTDIAWTGFRKEDMAGDVLAVLGELELDRVRVIGHDWGGWIGFLLALAHPERVEQLVTLNIPAPWIRPTPGNIAALRHMWHMPVLAAPYVGQALVQRRAGFVRKLIRRWAADHAGWEKGDYRIYARDLKASTRARAASLLYRTFLTHEVGPVLAGRYRDARLRVPTLMLHGQEDPVVSGRLLDGAERNADDLRVELIPGAGHFLPEERPEVVAERAHGFFQGVESPRAAAAG
jgi:pimeloyl-ACP methyl ester carboxylesterase